MTDVPNRYATTIADIDAANAHDPRSQIIEGRSRPVELIYAERMTTCLAKLYPTASEALRIAARAQHLRRWEIERARYPLGRDGYNAWRSACRTHHAALAADIMRRRGYDDVEIAQVGKIIRKEDLKRDPESQALENVAAVVFVQYHLADFATSHAHDDDAKIIAILRKTMRKMDAVGHAAVVALTLPAEARRLVGLAIGGG